MITGQLSKPLLPLRADMDACELRDDDKAASPDSELNDEPLLLSADTDSEEKMYDVVVESAGTEQVKVVVQVYCVSYSF
ncbi:hypothetical protein PO909_016920 [Leuciscus waleckii]